MEEGAGRSGVPAQGLRDDALDPGGAILTPDPISPTSDRDGLSSPSVLYAAPRMWGSAFGAGAGSSGESGSEGPRLMQDLTNGLPRMILLSTPVNMGRRKGRDYVRSRPDRRPLKPHPAGRLL